MRFWPSAVAGGFFYFERKEGGCGEESRPYEDATSSAGADLSVSSPCAGRPFGRGIWELENLM